MKAPEIVDSLSIAGDRTKVNDDSFGCAGNRVWVLDGATGLGSRLLPGNSDAAWLARNGNRLFHTHHGIRDTEQLVMVVIEGLASAFASEQISRPEARWQLPCASFLLLTFHPNTIQAAWLGDCRAILDIGGTIVSCGETPDGEARERALAARLGEGTGAAAMLRSPDVVQVLRDGRNLYNTGRGRWVLGLEPKAAAHLQMVSFPFDGAVTGLAMSDGFSALELKYRRYSTDTLIRAAEEKGLAALAGELRHIEEVEDPEGLTYPRFKRSDDASAMLFRAG